MATSQIKRFVRFHKDNPDVYALFKRFALQAIDAGMSRISARFILERIRWEVSVETKGAGWSTAEKRVLKLNDHHSPYYARLFILEHPEHRKRFNLRNVKGESST